MRKVREWVPRWWGGDGGAAGHALDLGLWPAELLYRGVVSVRNRGYTAGWLRSDAAPIPVVSLGNLGVGGAGKTPTTAWLARWMVERGRAPAVVLRGYGSDEVLVHRELNPDVPVYVGRMRLEAVQAAARDGRDVALLDDGFQHRRLRRDLDLVLVAAEQGSTRRRLLPRGPWREDVGSLARADAVVVTWKTVGSAAAHALARGLAPRVPGGRVAVARLEPTRLRPLYPDGAVALPLEEISGQEVLAVASLADPAPFVRHLEQAGARVELRAYPDHHDFSTEEALQIGREAGGRWVVMTRKEAVKLRPLLGPGQPAFLLEQSFTLESGREMLENVLENAIVRGGR